jgi:hypothetical protein
MTKQMTTMQVRITAMNTLENARQWNDTYEKFTFCIDLLDINARDRGSDFWVSLLEEKFEELLT